MSPTAFVKYLYLFSFLIYYLYTMQKAKKLFHSTFHLCVRMNFFFFRFFCFFVFVFSRFNQIRPKWIKPFINIDWYRRILKYFEGILFDEFVSYCVVGIIYTSRIEQKTHFLLKYNNNIQQGTFDLRFAVARVTKKKQAKLGERGRKRRNATNGESGWQKIKP